MPELIVDASVVVKWFVDEEYSNKAIKIRDMYIDGKIRILAPEIINFEILNALYYKKLFSENELREISEALDAYSFDLYSLKGEYSRKTVEIMFYNDITIYDASYISLAVMRNTFMYTADEDLISRLKGDFSNYVRSLRMLNF
ncbi:type II toxin-antitoxin system VapC family toxin [Candidatus Bathyarchaeota archaeon]|nr:type II toxin-antitoxin system VapC family toxin [Candidatus Bathyarchaeota archaeon]